MAAEITVYEAWKTRNEVCLERIIIEAKSLRSAKAKATRELEWEYGNWVETTVEFNENNEPIRGWKKGLGVRETALGYYTTLWLKEVIG